MRLSAPIYFFPLVSLLTLTFAHFELDSPPARGFNEDILGTFPCGGQQVSTNRTKIPLNDPKLSIALTMGHDQSAIQVLLGLGTDPGTNFNITLVHTFRQTGLGSFCLPDVAISAAIIGAPLIDGMNATLQVVTNGDPNGGLYNCADLTFSSTAQPPSSKCVNDTHVTATPFSGAAATRNANESTPDGQPQNAAASSSAPTPTSKNVGAPLETAAWGILGAAVAGGIALL